MGPKTVGVSSPPTNMKPKANSFQQMERTRRPCARRLNVLLLVQEHGLPYGDHRKASAWREETYEQTLDLESPDLTRNKMGQ